jgi:DNA-binding CsgD family transcriptional regulator
MTTTKKSGLARAINTWLSSLPPREPDAPSAAPTTLRRGPGRRVELHAPTSAAALTRREIDVLHLVAKDCTCAEAAAQLGVSPHTVVTHLKNAYRKLDVHSAAAAVMRVVQLGLLCVDAPHNPATPSSSANALAVLSDR